MKFTVLGHACLYIEHNDFRLLIDPWLVGSCYWRSWWNYPEVAPQLLDTLKPTHIYLTHLHWDHFHGPTLRRFHCFDPIIILPKCPTSRMIDDIKSDFKFSHVHELIHGKKYVLGDDFSVHSYQYNPFFVDSSLLIEAGGITLFDANDSKVFGLSLSHIIARHPPIDFVFRSHSSASPVPYCVDGVNPLTTSRSPAEYSNDFIAFAAATKAKFAIPFASSHVYLHNSSVYYNQYYNSPSALKSAFLSSRSASSCVLMPSSSSWSSDTGFELSSHDYSQLSNHISDMLLKHKGALSEHALRESTAVLNRHFFERYFHDFSESLTFPLTKFRFAFLAVTNISSTSGTLCIVDLCRNSVAFINDVSYSLDVLGCYNLSFVIKLPTLVLNDCVKKRMFNSFSPSKLLTIYDPSLTGYFSTLFTYLDMFENDALPLRRIFEPRQLVVRLRRWREILDSLFFVWITRIRSKPLYFLWHHL